MKKYIPALMLVTVLAGCDDASKVIDQAQDAANKAVDTVQEKMQSVDLSKVNLDQFGNAADSAKALAASVEEALNANFSDPEVLDEVQAKVANAYSCLVDASSESTAEELMNTVMATISNAEAQTLIEKGIAKAEATQECIM